MANHDYQAASKAFADFLDALGVAENGDPELVGTPERVATLFGDLFGGLHAPAPDVATIAVKERPSDDPVVVAGIPFHSLCVHHMVPFFGEISVAYVPADQLIGFGAIPRLVRYFAARPQLQERLVEDIAAHLQALLEPRGLLVFSTARQLCVEMRGEKVQPRHVAMASRGCLGDGAARQQVLELIRQ